MRFTAAFESTLHSPTPHALRTCAAPPCPSTRPRHPCGCPSATAARCTARGRGVAGQLCKGTRSVPCQHTVGSCTYASGAAAQKGTPRSTHSSHCPLRSLQRADGVQAFRPGVAQDLSHGCHWVGTRCCRRRFKHLWPHRHADHWGDLICATGGKAKRRTVVGTHPSGRLWTAPGWPCFCSHACHTLRSNASCHHWLSTHPTTTSRCPSPSNLPHLPSQPSCACAAALCKWRWRAWLGPGAQQRPARCAWHAAMRLQQRPLCPLRHRHPAGPGCPPAGWPARVE